MSGVVGNERLAPSSVVTELSTLTLDALERVAALQTRIDRKYVLDAATAERVLRSVADRLVVLEIDDVRCFRYDSLYFDTPELRSYHAAAFRRRHRFKVRVRRYVDAGSSALEVKTRGLRGETMKSRLMYEPDDIETLTPNAQRYVDEALEEDGIAGRLRPTMWTSYDRSTMVDLDDRSRITVDRHLRACPAGPAGPAGGWRMLTDALVIETKSQAAPTPLDRALWTEHIRPVAMSKYAIAVAAHRPELPSNRWSRILRQHVNMVR